MMKKIISILSILAFTLAANAQSGMVVVNKDKKTTASMKLSSVTTFDIAGQSGETKTDASSDFDISVKNVASDKITLETTLKKIKFNANAMGQEMGYDSEKKDNDGPFAENIGKNVGKSVTIEIDPKTGKEIKAKKDDAEEQAGAMMALIGLDNIKLIDFFFVVPADKKVGDSWKVETNEKDIKTTTEYKVDKIEGDVITVSFTKQSEGSFKMDMQGMSMTLSNKTTGNGTILTNAKSSALISYKSKSSSTGDIEVMGTSGPISSNIDISIDYK